MERVFWGATIMRPHIADKLHAPRRLRRRERRASEPLVIPDPAVVRARRAGGPVDEACYTCECGYVFRAAVSTTVACPHCDTEQPW
jgi:hypothetical protein